MGVGAGRQVVNRPGRLVRELLQHKQLRATDADLLFAAAKGAPQYPNDPADGVQRSRKLGVSGFGRHG